MESPSGMILTGGASALQRETPRPARVRIPARFRILLIIFIVVGEREEWDHLGN
jgi:hypothetical protein